MGSERFTELIQLIEEGLLPGLHIESVDPTDPVVVHRVPTPWEWVGAGNYTAVFAHPEYPDKVVKVYAPGRPGLAAEAEVYRRIGMHPAYSRCWHLGSNYLVLQRLEGVTFYDCLRKGIPIPEPAVREIDEALQYARRRGLNPRDVHAKNVMVADGHGLVADISDFTKPGKDTKWEDLRRAYYKLYLPLFGRHPLPVPDALLNVIRKGYRRLRKLFGS